MAQEGHCRKRGAPLAEPQTRLEGSHDVPDLGEKILRAALPVDSGKESFPPPPPEKKRRLPRTPLRDITALVNSMDWVASRRAAAAARRRNRDISGATPGGDPTQQEEAAPTFSTSQQRSSGSTLATLTNSGFPSEQVPDSEREKLSAATAAAGSVRKAPAAETAKKMTRPSTLMSLR